jgi:hypothetical protein
MGAWGHLFDENDDAADWLADFEDSLNWATVDEALAITEADYIEAPDASNALAAAEVVAAGLGKGSPRLERAISEWALAHSSEAAARREQAVSALTVVRDNSELQELWQEADEYADWQTSVNETLSRL